MQNHHASCKLFDDLSDQTQEKPPGQMISWNLNFSLGIDRVNSSTL